jgi:DNA-binding transcriptional MerR regulator
MTPSLSIGDFSRATHLSVKTLRHYHQTTVLEPAEIDAVTGYRRYDVGQIATAQVIRRFRSLDMPLDEIRAVLGAPDLATRNELIAAHMRRLESGLERTQLAVASLRDLLEHPDAPVAILHRRIDATLAASVTETIDVADALEWYQGALGELYATLSAQGAVPSSAAGGIFSNDLFTLARGEATVFVPTVSTIRPMGRVVPSVIPAVELATTVHDGPPNGIDRAYGALASYVTRHELAIEGPLREYYLVDHNQSADSATWRTQVGWPIFATGA